MASTWRIKAVRGHGWAQHIDADGRVAVTAEPRAAHQWDSRERAEVALAQIRPGLVPMRVVEGPAFTPDRKRS